MRIVLIGTKNCKILENMERDYILAMSLTPAKIRKAKEWKEIYAFYVESRNNGYEHKVVLKACVNKFGHAQATIEKAILAKGVLIPNVL